MLDLRQLKALRFLNFSRVKNLKKNPKREAIMKVNWSDNGDDIPT